MVGSWWLWAVEILKDLINPDGQADLQHTLHGLIRLQDTLFCTASLVSTLPWTIIV